MDRFPDSEHGAGPRGGKTLKVTVGYTTDLSSKLAKANRVSEPASFTHWYALYTRSRCEQLVYNQLAMKGFHVFLPKLEMWSRRAGWQHLISIPMFPGYLFLHHTIDKLEVISKPAG
jgi:hypothetical protein